MNRFGDGYQSDKGEEDFDQNELENNFSQTVSKSFISSVPPTIQNVSSQNEKSAVYSTIYQKDPKRVLNHLLDIPVWRQVLQKTEEFSKINGNSESIQKVMNSLIKWQTQTGCFLAQNFQRHYTANKFDENLQKRLAKDVQALILKYIRGKGTEDYLKQECEEFSTTLNFNSLFLGESCSCIKTNTKYLKKINDEISENQIYKILYRYGKNIYYLEYQFIKYYFTQFFNKLSYKVFYDILQQLIKDPFYSWTNRKDLNYEQNTVLIEKIWLNDKNPLFKLIEAQKYSHTTQRLIDLDKRKIEDFLLHNAKFPLSRQELDDIRIVLDSGDLQSFFDKTRYIKDELKKVYPYIAKNCEHYLNLNKEQVCLVQLQQQNLLRLRSKLFQMLKKEQFNISDWSLIENSAMSNTLNKAQRAFKKDLASYFSLKKWALQNLSDYFSKAFEPKRQKDLVKHELKLCLINSKVILKYEQVETIVKELLDTPYTEVIQASGLLKPNDINLLKEQLQKLELFRQYSAKFKEDPQYIRKKAESEIYKVLDSVDLKLTSDKKEELYQRFLKNPRASAIYETPNICYLYKQTIFKKLSEIEEIRDYIQNFKKVQRTQKLSMVKSQLQKIITNRTDYELVLDYISINGEIIFQNDQDCSVKLQQTYSDLKKVMTKIKPQNRKNLRQLQQKPFFIELKQQLPELYNIYLNQCKAKFKYTVKNIISKNFQLGEDEKIQLQDIIIDIIDSQDIKALDENQRLKDSNFNSVVSQIKGSKMFKLLSNSTNAIKANQSKYVQITLKNKIRSIYDHQNLVEFSPEQKGAIINSLIQRMDFEQIKTFNFLNAIQQQFIITFITQSDEYKQFCNKGKKSNNTINGAAQPSIQKSEKVVEKKKIQPPRAAEKKEEQSPSERSIPINPQRVESINISKKQVQLTQQFQDVIPDKPSQEINPPLTKQQLETRKKQIIRKWTEIMANINDKNLFTRERLAQSNPTQFVEKLMMAHPWTPQNTTFFQASKDVLRKKIIVELQAIIKQKGEFLEDIKTLQSV